MVQCYNDAMKRIIFAVLLSLIPGLGQVYNGERKRGALLFFISGMFLFAPVLWLILRISPNLPNPKEQPLTPQMIQLEAEKIIRENSHILNLMSFAFLGVWAYAITQAYFKAKELSDQETETGEG